MLQTKAETFEVNFDSHTNNIFKYFEVIIHEHKLDEVVFFFEEVSEIDVQI